MCYIYEKQDIKYDTERDFGNIWQHVAIYGKSGSHGELMDEHFNKENWSPSRDNFHILIQLRFLIYPDQWQFLVLEVRNGHFSYFGHFHLLLAHLLTPAGPQW